MKFSSCKMNGTKPRKRRQPNTPRSTIDFSLPWFQMCPPNKISDLAIHSGKVKEVEEWIYKVFRLNNSSNDTNCESDANSNGSRISKILLLTGPSGSGKSTSIKVICKENNIEVKELTSEDIAIEDKTQEMNQSKARYSQSQVKQFQEFIFDQCRTKIGSFNSANANANDHRRKLVLVEDLPSGFYYTPDNYHNVLRHMVRVFKTSHVPIVFIISYNGESSESLLEGDSRRRMTSYTLFPAKLIEELNIKEIKFNPTAPTIIKKALKKLPMYHIFSEKDVDHVCTFGDLRSAMNTIELHYNHLFDPKNLLLNNIKKPKIQNGSPSSQVSDDESNLNVRDRMDTTFHYIGKIIYSKRVVDSILPVTSKYRQLPLLENINELIRKSPIGPSLLLLNLHQMYDKRTSVPSNASASLIDSLSLADRLGWHDYAFGSNTLCHEIQSEIATRSTMFYVPPSLVTSTGEKYRYASCSSPSSKKKGIILQSKLVFLDHNRNQRDILSEARNVKDSLFPLNCSMKSFFMDVLYVSHLQTPNLPPSNNEKNSENDEVNEDNDIKEKKALYKLVDFSRRVNQVLGEVNFDEEFDDELLDEDMDID